MNNFKRNIYRTSIEEEPIVENYCVSWTAANNGNIKMETSGYIDFTSMLAGRTIAFLDGAITGYIIAGVGTFSCEIPVTHTTSKAKWSTDSLPVVTDKVLTSLIYTVNIIFNNATEFDIIDGQTNAIVIPEQTTSEYNSCV